MLTKPVEIEGTTYTANELRVQDVLEILDAAEDMSLLELAERFCSTAFDGLAMADLKAMHPSDILRLKAAFEEANAPFFELAALVGLAPLLKKVRERVETLLSKLFTASLSRAMQTRGATGGETSS